MGSRVDYEVNICINNIQPFLPDQHAERDDTEKYRYTIKVGEDEVNSLDVTEEDAGEAKKEKNWMIHALILALIAAQAMVYY